MTELHRVKFKSGYPKGVWIVSQFHHSGLCHLVSDGDQSVSTSAYESSLVRLPRFDDGQLVTINIDSYFWGREVAAFVKQEAGSVFRVRGLPDENNKYNLQNVATLREVKAHVSVLEKWTGSDWTEVERRVMAWYSGDSIANPTPTGRKSATLAMGYEGPYSHRPSSSKGIYGRSEITFKGKTFDDMPWGHKAAARHVEQLNKAYMQGWRDRGEDPYAAFGAPKGETYQPKTDGLDPKVAAVAEKFFEEQVQPVAPEATSEKSPTVEARPFMAAMREAQRAVLKMRLAVGDITPALYHNTLKGVARREKND